MVTFSALTVSVDALPAEVIFSAAAVSSDSLVVGYTWAVVVVTFSSLTASVNSLASACADWLIAGAQER